MSRSQSAWTPGDAGPRRARVLVLHPSMREYREALFTHLHEAYETAFLFTMDSTGSEASWRVRALGRPGYRMQRLGLRATVGMLAIVARDDYDCLLLSHAAVNTSLAACLIAKARGRRVVAWEEMWRWPDRTWMHRLWYRAAARVSRLYDAWVVTGSRAREFVLSRGVPENQVEMAFQCVPDLRGRYSDVTDTSDGKTVLFLSRLDDLKGPDVAIAAVAEVEEAVPGAHLLMVGDGPLMGSCRALASEVDANVEFTGWIDVERDRASAFASSDVFVLPGRRHRDNVDAWPMVLSEAASFGLPLIATQAVGSAPDLIVEDENGYILDEASARSLAERLALILGDGDTRSRMRLESRRIFERVNDQPAMNRAFDRAISTALTRSK